MKEKLTYISNNMKSIRVRNGLTQQEVADKIEVSRQTICDYEVNVENVSIKTLNRLAELYNCKLSDFFVEIEVTQSDK